MRRRDVGQHVRGVVEVPGDLPGGRAQGRAVCPSHVGPGVPLREPATVCAPLGGVGREADEGVEEAAAALAKGSVIGRGGERRRIGGRGVLPRAADQILSVVRVEPLVPDDVAVDLDVEVVARVRRVEARDRNLRHPGPRPDVGDVVVDVRVDLVLHPHSRGLEHPGVLEHVVAELEDVVVLVRGRDLHRRQRVAVPVLRRAVVVVHHQVARLRVRCLPRVGRGVAEDALAAEVGDVDIGLVEAAPADPAVADGRPPAHLDVLDLVDVLEDPVHLLDVVGYAVVVRVVERRRVRARVQPVDAELRAAVGVVGSGEAGLVVGGAGARARQEPARLGALAPRERGQVDRELLEQRRHVEAGLHVAVPQRVARLVKRALPGPAGGRFVKRGGARRRRLSGGGQAEQCAGEEDDGQTAGHAVPRGLPRPSGAEA